MPYYVAWTKEYGDGRVVYFRGNEDTTQFVF